MVYPLYNLQQIFIKHFMKMNNISTFRPRSSVLTRGKITKLDNYNLDNFKVISKGRNDFHLKTLGSYLHFMP